MLSSLVTTQCLLLWPMYTWWLALISQDPCIPSNTKAPQGRKEWRQEVDTSHISRITWKTALWVKLYTGRSWTCGCVDSSSVVNQWANFEPHCNGYRFGYWSSRPPCKISPRECVSYAPSDYFSNAHRPEDIMCQWPLVVCADVVATVHASDCWHQSQQSALPFIQPQGRRSSDYQRMPNPWRSCFNHIHWPKRQSAFWALL
jgi:hypothetical protein